MPECPGPPGQYYLAASQAEIKALPAVAIQEGVFDAARIAAHPEENAVTSPRFREALCLPMKCLTVLAYTSDIHRGLPPAHDKAHVQRGAKGLQEFLENLKNEYVW